MKMVAKTGSVSRTIQKGPVQFYVDICHICMYIYVYQKHIYIYLSTHGGIKLDAFVVLLGTCKGPPIYCTM